MATDDDMKDVLERLGSLEKFDKSVWEWISDNFKAFEASEKDLRTQIAELKKQGGGPDKEIADLKARVKELETKLGKMGKK